MACQANCTPGFAILESGACLQHLRAMQFMQSIIANLQDALKYPERRARMPENAENYRRCEIT
jgi:hypothetical protein